MKHDYVVPAHAERRHRAAECFRLLVAVGHQHHDAGARGEMPDTTDGVRQPTRSRRLGARQGEQEQLQMTHRGGHDIDQLFLERGQPDTIALRLRQPSQRRHEKTRVVELGDRPAAKVHRARRIEREDHPGVGIGVVLLDVEPVGASVHAPIDTTQVIAGLIRAMLGEIQRRTFAQRSVLAVHEAIHDRARQQREIGDARQQGGVEKGGRSGGHEWLRATSGAAAHSRADAR